MKLWLRHSCIAVLATLALLGGPRAALAACTSPAGTAGTITWNGTDSVIWCNGTVWYALKDAAGGGGGTSPAFSVKKSADQVLSSTDTWIKVTWDTEVFDTNNNFASNSFTPTVAGKYLISASLVAPSNGVPSHAFIAIYKNGTHLISNNGPTSYAASSITTVVDMNGSSDYVEVYVYSINTGNIRGPGDIEGAVNFSPASFSGSLVGGTVGGGGSATAAGSDKNLQFNDGGTTFAGAGKLIWDKTTESLAIGTTSSADTKSLLELSSTTKGFLPPRMTTTQRDAISSPTEGLVLYNATTHALTVRTNSAWLELGSGGGGGGGGTVPAFSVGKSANQTLPATYTWTKVTWDTEVFDTNNNFASNKFTPTVAGKYLISTTLLVTANNQQAFLAFYKNGNHLIDVRGSLYYSSSSLTTIVDMNGSTDYIEVYVYSDITGEVWGPHTGPNYVPATFSGSLLGGGGGGSATAAGSTGQIQFNGASSAFAADSGLNWDNSNKRLGIGTASPAFKLDVVGTAAFSSNVFMGRTTASGTSSPAALTIQHLYGVNYGLVLVSDNVGASGVVRFDNPNGNVGSIVVAGTGVTYNTASDRRLKENITDTQGAMDKILRIPVYDFSFKKDPAHKRETGFIAQELERVFPEAVTTNGDNGEAPLAANANAWSVDYGRLTPLLVKAIQELKAANDNLRATVEAQGAEIEALKAAIH